MIHPSHSLSPWTPAPSKGWPDRLTRTCTGCGAEQEDNQAPGRLRCINTQVVLEEECGRKAGKAPLDPISVFWSPEGCGGPSRLVKVRPGSGAAVPGKHDGYELPATD